MQPFILAPPWLVLAVASELQGGLPKLGFSGNVQHPPLLPPPQSDPTWSLHSPSGEVVLKVWSLTSPSSIP